MEESGDNEPIEPAHFEPVKRASFNPPRVRLRIGALASGVILCACAIAAWFILTAKSLYMEIDPEGADVSIDGIHIKLADRLLIRKGEYSLEITAPGYFPMKKTLAVDDDQNQHVSLSLAKLPGRLRLVTTPVAGARIEIDGKETGRTPMTVQPLAAGDHSIRIVVERYLPFEEVVAIQGKGIEQMVEVALTPAWAEVTVTSRPAGAQVYVDDELVGQTPLAAEILHGKRAVRVHHPGYKEWRDRVAILPNQPVTLPEIELEPADAVVRVESRPDGASVTVNGEYRGETPLEVALTPGESATLHLFKEGYQRVRRALTLKSGEEKRLRIDLPPLLASVQIIADPGDAELYIDGVAKGKASQTIELTTRPHRILLRKSGYADYEATVTPRIGIAQRIEVKLETLEQARFESVKTVIKTTAGQTLKLFRPNENFTLGASRREPGRRANEILRQVKLTRPFYLSLYEVTNSEFKAYESSHSSGRVQQHALDTPRQPVVKIDWEQAALYCNWLSRQDSLPPFYEVRDNRVVGFDPGSNGYRLPTEAEWAWAARSAGDGNRLKFPWGDTFPPTSKSGNYADRSAAGIVGSILGGYQDGFAVSAPVGSFPPNGKGLFDMGGNVAEWVHDFYDIQVGQKAILTDPLGPLAGKHHVIRGAGWAHGTLMELRLSFRDYDLKGRDNVGFRIARYLE